MVRCKTSKESVLIIQYLFRNNYYRNLGGILGVRCEEGGLLPPSKTR